MTVLTAFPSCCGCDIISGFCLTPETGIEFQKDPEKRDRWGNALYLRDENGQNIPVKTAREGLIELIATKSSWGNQGALPDRGFVCILNEQQIPLWQATLKELGFVFLFKWNNAVHLQSMNYMFGLAKHNGDDEVAPPLEPPPGWEDLPEPDQEEVKTLYTADPALLNDRIFDADEDLLDELDEYYEEDEEEDFDDPPY